MGGGGGRAGRRGGQEVVSEKHFVPSGWLSVCMLLGDVGDTDIHKQHDAAVMEMRACIHNLT